MGCWIFQANPKRFDIDGFLATNPTDTNWLVTRYAKDIQIGDELYIWRAAGENPSGIIAKAEIVAAPAQRPEDPNAVPFWKDESGGIGLAMRAGIRIREIAAAESILTRDALRQDAVLAELDIIVFPNQTNFAVDARQTSRLASLWSGAFTVAPEVAPRHWRMAMRVGENGYEMWDECFDLGVAAITYDTLAETDFSSLTLDQAKEVWADLAPARKSSLRALAYDMRGGDILYVKQGVYIVGKGIIRGIPGQRAYAYNAAARRIVDPNGTPWLQQVRVSWLNDFSPLQIEVGSNQRYTIQALNAADVQRLERSEATALADTTVVAANQEALALNTESYLRATPARMRIIARQHNGLSNAFARWLRDTLSISPTIEKQQVDVRFQVGDRDVIAELKVCFGIGTRHAVREALGQLLEYNYYPARTQSSLWLIVLDVEPLAADKLYVELLRQQLALPLFIGWRSSASFEFHPSWHEAVSFAS